jgi:DNA topoisomerase-1
MKAPPLPFNTSQLLQTASNVLGLSPKLTMSLLQILYQDGHITYIRTENTKLSLDFLQKAGPFISAKYNPDCLGDFANLENRDTGNPHEAIRPTHVDVENIVTEDTKLSGLYRLIWRTTIESCMRAAKYNCYKLTIPAPLDAMFTCTLEIPTFLGWKLVTKDLGKGLGKDLTKDSTKDSTKESTKESDSLGISDPSKILFYIQSLAKNIDKTTPIKYQSISTSLTVSNTHSHYTEAGLISKLEGLGIGRPSTFASLVETVIDRGYVTKTNIDGRPVQCDEYTLKNGNITKESITKIFGTEKNKLLLQPIGELCIDFLIEHFGPLFEYNYTKKMEDTLDEISLKTDVSVAESAGADLCKTVDTEIKTYIKLVDKIEKQAYPLLSDSVLGSVSVLYEFIFTKYGGSIRNTRPTDSLADFEYEYQPVKKDFTIDLEKLKRGEYSVAELLDEGPTSLGDFKDFPIYLKNGQYGHYLEWNGTKQSLKDYEGDPKTISLAESVIFIQNLISPPENNSAFFVRELSMGCSIRRGKYGPYIHYMKSGAKKPEFYSIKKFKEDFTQCDAAKLIEWVNKTYKVSLEL